MPIVINNFRELRDTYTTWEALSEFLKSPEGGSLRVIDAPGRYAIVRYTKGVSDFTKPHVPLFRSVVWDKEANQSACVAPPKAEQGAPPSGTSVIVSDFVDGVMICGFRPVDGSEPRLATRTSIGARGTFYSTKTFAELFESAVPAGGAATEWLTRILEPGQFASFVLQHPEHKTVAQVPYPRIFVTSIGSVDSSGDVSINPFPTSEVLRTFLPQAYPAGDADAQNLLTQIGQGRNHTWQGLVFQEANTLRRWRLRNPQYVLVRTLRGAEASPMARFVRLRARGQMKQYLSYFKEENKMMWQFEQTLRQRSQELYDAYNAMHKQKMKGMRDLPYCLRPHVYALHGKYLAGFTNGNPSSVLKSTVIDYVNALAEADQLKLLEGDRVPLAPHPRPIVS